MSSSDLELDFVSGKLFDVWEVPKHQRFLFKYFPTDEQRMFVRYFLSQGRHDQFVEHTGIRFKRRWRQYLAQRILYLLREHKQAKDSGDIETLSQIETGRWEVPGK